jgi:hypothetical protein
MNNLIKIGAVIVIVALSVSLLWTWFKVFLPHQVLSPDAK